MAILTFKPDFKKVRRESLKGWFFSLLLYAILPVLGFLFNRELVWESYGTTVVILSATSLLMICIVKRLTLLVFDTDRQEVTIETATFYKRFKQKILGFHEITLQSSSPVTEWQLKLDPLRLTFFTRQQVVLKLSKGKDGLDAEDLEEIQAAVKELCRPLPQNPT
ncbi:MAG: hypothetical protein ACO1OQ_15220 [Rufibacter sp.]